MRTHVWLISWRNQLPQLVTSTIKTRQDALKASEAKVSTVSVKLPPFWPDKTKLWFTQMTFKISGIKYSWHFQVADVHKSIIGIDFLRVNNLLVDLTNKRLVRLQDLSIINSVVKEGRASSCQTNSTVSTVPTLETLSQKLAKGIRWKWVVFDVTQF